MSIGVAIKAAREAQRRSQKWLADNVGQAQTTVSSWERGRTEPTRADVARVAEALGMPLAQLEGFDRSGAKVRVVGYVGAGDAAHYYEPAELEVVDAPDHSTHDTVAAEVRGQSIGPFFENWLVFYDDRRHGVPRDLLGELCVVGLTDGRTLVKWVRASAIPRRYHLFSQTEPPMLDEEVEWAAKVKSMRPR